MSDALIRAALIAPFLLIFWGLIEWRSGNLALCRIGLHRWRRVLTDPGREHIGFYCTHCKRAESL